MIFLEEQVKSDIYIELHLFENVSFMGIDKLFRAFKLRILQPFGYFMTCR